MSCSFSPNCGSLDSLKCLGEVRLQSVRRPDALHARVAQPDRLGHLAHRPMRARRRLLGERHVHDPLDHFALAAGRKSRPLDWGHVDLRVRPEVVVERRGPAFGAPTTKKLGRVMRRCSSAPSRRRERGLGGHLVGDGERRGQPRALDAVEIDQPRHPVHLRPLDGEVGGRPPGGVQLRADAGVARG